MNTQFVSIDPTKCIGCSICEYVCAFEKDKSFNPLRSRIRIVRILSLCSIAMVCRFCENAPCVTACPRDALQQSTVTGIIRVNERKCDGCGWCIPPCPYGAVMVDPETNRVMMCDLCNGTPRCVDFCPTDALQLRTEDTITLSHALTQSIDQARNTVSAVKNHKWQKLFTEVNDKMRQVEQKLQLLYDEEHALHSKMHDS